MIAEKDFEDSDSDDSDFVADLENDLSNDSAQTEYESSSSEGDDSNKKNNPKKKKKKSKTKKSTTNQLTESTTTESPDTCNKESPIDEKARADSLWQNFLSDTGNSSKPQYSSSTSSNISEISNNSTNETDTSKKVTSNSVKTDNTEISNEKDDTKKNTNLNSFNKKEDEHGGLSFITQKNNMKKRGISNILNNINKKPKLSTLEKSKLDWNQFKKENDLNEEISNFNRGKNGYLERQDFLQRADTRQFEIEKELRNVGKRKNR